MKPGLDRQDVPYKWPPAILRGATTRRLIYLDLNHWIGLAKAAKGHANGERYTPALEAARRAVSSGHAIFPLSASHYQELAAIKAPRQRADIARVMEELSAFHTLLSHSVIKQCELEAVLDDLVGPRPKPYASVPLVGHGFAYAFGQVGRLRLKLRDGTDATDAMRHSWTGGPHDFDRRLGDAELQVERQILAGPSDEGLPRLRQLGYDPVAARRVPEARADQELDLKRRLDADPQWRRRLRDVVSARYMAIEMIDHVVDGLQARKVSVEAMRQTRKAARRLVDSMPSGDVFVTLVMSSHRNPQLKWKSNDMFDIDAMSLAVAYCDVVVTERHRQHQLTTSGVDTRLATRVLGEPEELTQLLAESAI